MKALLPAVINGRTEHSRDRRRLLLVAALCGLALLAWSVAPAADKMGERGATIQKNVKRRSPGTTNDTAGSSVFSAIPPETGIVWTNPIIIFTPKTLDFGSVERGKSVTNTILLENAGRGTIVGTASVPPPFRIDSGGSYSIKEREVQIVTVVYTPSGAPTDTATLTLTGAGTAKATVMGKLRRRP